MFNSLFRQFARETNPQEHRKIDLPDANKDIHSVVAHPTSGGGETPTSPLPEQRKPLLSASVYALLMTILLLFAGAAALWFWRESSALRRQQKADQQAHGVMLDSLVNVKTGLETRLDSLETTWVSLAATNDSLYQQLAYSTDIIAEKDAVIREVRAENAREEKELRAQIQRLQAVQTRYETIIAVLNSKNIALTAENARLRGRTDSLVEQLSTVSGQLAAQIKQREAVEFRGNNFRVEPSRKNDRLTARAKKTRAIHIAFDLNQVPEQYRKLMTLYLVIADETGVPILTKNPKQVTIHAPKGTVQIITQQTQTLMIRQNQTIEFDYELEDRLPKGVYTVAVYAENGLLGAASFRLNR